VRGKREKKKKCLLGEKCTDINLKNNVIFLFYFLFFCINIENENFSVVEEFVC
jgi:hypothetical protein